MAEFGFHFLVFRDLCTQKKTILEAKKKYCSTCELKWKYIGGRVSQKQKKLELEPCIVK
jgi:hypothetical protein